ncbi:MAG: hypothetical protein FWD25_09185 [Clostridia bacterium]|nr:hypothetical protein [Clostridia bacterium]
MLRRKGPIDVSPKDKKLCFLLAMAAAALPCMFFFFLVNQNQDYLPLVPCLLVGGAFAAVGLLAYAVLAWFFRTRLVLFTILLPAWTLFFTYGTLHAALSMRTLPGWGKVLLLLSLFAGAFIVLSLLLRAVRSKTPFVYLSFIVVFVFAFNLISVISNGVAMERNRREVFESGLAELHIKTEFFVEEGAARPDIYWFHTDTRMSIQNVEKYFGDAQEELITALHERGFILNADAFLNAGFTSTAVPALMCPSYYDNVQRAKMEDLLLVTIIGRSGLGRSPQDLLARQNNELLYAFSAAGYEINTIAAGYNDYHPMDRHYNIYSGSPRLLEQTIDAGGRYPAFRHQGRIELQALADLLEKATMLPQLHVGISRARDLEHLDDRPLVAERIGGWALSAAQALLDVLQRGAAPRFVVVMDLAAHIPFRIDENGTLLHIEPGHVDHIDGYLPNQKFADNILLEMIDFVLESDPNAVIILQADHGLQTRAMESQMRADGYTDEQIIEIQNGVFSAVRVPAQYGGIPEELLPLDPRNIARLLVNQFVGENYEYIQ